MKTTSIFETFTRNNHEAIVFSNFDGYVTMWNQGAECLFGYSQDEIQKFSIFSLVDKDSFDVFNTVFETLKKGRMLSFETNFVNKAGEILSLQVSAGIVKEAEVEPLIYYIFRDLTRKKKMESRISKLMMFLEDNPDLTLEWDRNLGITYANQSVQRLLSSAGFENTQFEKILPQDFQNYMQKIVGSNRRLANLEVEFNGRTLSYSFIPAVSDPDKVLIIGKEVTDIKKLEEEVDSARERISQILDLIETTLQELRFLDVEQETPFKTIFSHAVRDISDEDSPCPTHIFIAIENDERMMSGYLLEKQGGDLKEVYSGISIHPRKLKNLISERRKAMIANWRDDSPDILIFQRRFPEEITKWIPEIRNFASYRITGDRQGVLIGFNYPKDVTVYDGETIRGLAMAISAIFSLQYQIKQKEEAQFAIVGRIAELAEKRDQETGEHLKRMRNYARIIAEEMSKKPKFKGIITTDYIKRIYNSAPLHDIAKVGVADAILQKPGKLTDMEYELMRRHTIMGGEILEGPKIFEMAREIALYHHEKYDGSGYPFGLSGEDIPLSARIVAIADVYDAMTSKRVYKEAFSHDRTKKLIEICSGGHFDPDVVEAFLAREQDFLRIKEMFKD